MKIYGNYEERLYSTGNEYLDDLLERAFCDGYEYAQREFAGPMPTIKTALKPTGIGSRVGGLNFTPAQRQMRATQRMPKMTQNNGPQALPRPIQAPGQGVNTPGASSSLRSIGVVGSKGGRF